MADNTGLLHLMKLTILKNGCNISLNEEDPSFSEGVTVFFLLKQVFKIKSHLQILKTSLQNMSNFSHSY